MKNPASLPDFVTTVITGGRRMSLFSDGTLLPVVAGGDGSGEGGTGGPTPPTPPTPPAPTPPPGDATFTQADLDRIATREKAEGKRAAVAELAEQLGCTPEEAKAKLDWLRQAEDSEKSEATKAREAADREKAEAERAKTEAKRERLAAKVERALVTAKVKDDRLTNAARLVDVADDADDEAIKAAVETFSKATPEWFGNGGTGTPPPAPSGVPVGTGGQPLPAGVDPIEAGREIARKRFGTKTA